MRGPILFKLLNVDEKERIFLKNVRLTRLFLVSVAQFVMVVNVNYIINIMNDIWSLNKYFINPIRPELSD